MEFNIGQTRAQINWCGQSNSVVILTIKVTGLKFVAGQIPFQIRTLTVLQYQLIWLVEPQHMKP